MTDTLHDLLHESVDDADLADMHDLADVAWRAGARARRRRVSSAVAGVAAVALVVGGVVWAVDQRSSHRAAPPVQSPSPTVSSAPKDRSDEPDGKYFGTSVWWAPGVASEDTLAAYPDNPLPASIDFSAPVTPLVGDPVGNALAAFALLDSDGQLERVDVLGEDGLLRLIELGPDPHGPAPVSPMRDPEGHLRIRAGASMLSPSGKYLMFPQTGSIRVLRLADQQWSTIDTGTHATWDATWTADDDITLWDPGRPAGHSPLYDVKGSRVGRRGGPADDLVPRFVGDPYGLARRSPNGSRAQTYVADADVPQPPQLHLSAGQSDWIGVASVPNAILVLPQESARHKQCCQVAGWLDSRTVVYESRSSEGLRLIAWRVGSGRFWQVSRVVGWTPGEETVVSSYARLSPAEDCCS
jgi:hypothetical protein